MALQPIQFLMGRLADLHQMFESKGYQLSELDKQSIKRLIEDVNIELLTSSVKPVAEQPRVQQIVATPVQAPMPTPQPVTQVPVQNIPQQMPPQSVVPKAVAVTPQPQTQEVADVNDEIDELFFPKEVAQSTTQVKAFQLGINERIMFARELFDNNVVTMQAEVRKFQQFSNKKKALDFFDNKYLPTQLQKGKDEEVLNEFRSLIQRMYSL